jgi:hypothetical protein
MSKGVPKNGVNKGWYKKGQPSPNKGKVASLETLQKMRISRLGKKVVFTEDWKKNLSLASKGKPKPWLKGKTRIITDEWRKNMSIAKRFTDRSLLKKSDRQNSGAYYEWRNLVKKRDNNCCKIDNEDCCGKIEAHHILSWREHPELRYEVNNGITLCRFHHPLKYSEEKELSPYFTSLILKSYG